MKSEIKELFSENKSISDMVNKASLTNEQKVDLLRIQWTANSMDVNAHASVMHLFKKDIQDLVEIVCPTGTVDEKIQLLKDYLASPIVKLLPFPSVLKPDRFEYDATLSRCFKCFGTSDFTRFVEMPASEEREVFGSIGSGKSHIVAMYVVYLHCVHCIIKEHNSNQDQLNQMQNVPIPVYLSDCKLCDSEGDLVSKMITAFCYSWTFEKNIDIINEAWNIKIGSKLNKKFDLHEFLYDQLVLDSVNDLNYLYVFDDWKAFSDPSDVDPEKADKKSYKKSLENLTTNKKLLVAFSANTAKGHIPSTGWQRFSLYGGLPEDTRDENDNIIPNAEWTALQAMHQTTIDNMMEHSYDANDDTDTKREAKRVTILEELSFLSGRVPLLVKEMIKGDNASWSDRQSIYSESDTQGAGGWQLDS